MLKASFLASVVSFLCFCPWNEQWKSTKSSWLTFSVRVQELAGLRRVRADFEYKISITTPEIPRLKNFLGHYQLAIHRWTGY
ncbi:hypothetical protein GFB73_20225 [Escherichia coli]|nr:hypothetical protein [Escherichia coli]